MDIADEAIEFIEDKEISDKRYYDQHYQHFDWPGGSSGATVGIGYDCGYCTPAEIEADWAGIVPDHTIAVLKEASGLKGHAAKDWVRNNCGRVSISYAEARQEFTQREIQKWTERVRDALPNTDKLSPMSFGALVSLAYNRGCSFHLDGDRYTEMRNIHSCMCDERFEDIPDEIEAMVRLWPNSRGLRERRMQEAALFRSGLVLGGEVTSGL